MDGIEVTIKGIVYIIGIDADDNAYARTYNERHKTWVRLNFKQIPDPEAVDAALDILRRDYVERMLC